MPNYITYKQADSRWGKKNYNGSSTMATAGCGPSSVAMLAYAVDGKSTPWTVAQYMQKHGYAIRNNGTAWAGIPASMKAFGLQDVKNVAKMADVFSYMAKGYCGVFLFRAGTKGGVTWTTAGHYIAVTGYKYENKKHYFYTRDSGGRNHTGWYCYETQMMGLIPQVWVGKVPASAPAPAPAPATKKPTGKYSGTIPTPTLKKGSKGTQVKYLQSFLNWYLGAKLKVDGIFGNDTLAKLKTFQKTEGISVDGIYGKISQGKAKTYKAPAPAKTNAQKIVDMAKKCAWPYGTAKAKYTYPSGSRTADYTKALQTAYGDRKGWGAQTKAGASCDVFVGTVIRACGYDKDFPRGLDGVVKHCKNNPKWTLTGIKSMDKMQAGDIVFENYKGQGGHIVVYLGNGLVANAHYASKAYGVIQKYSSVMKKASDCKEFNVYRSK